MFYCLYSNICKFFLNDRSKAVFNSSMEHFTSCSNNSRSFKLKWKQIHDEETRETVYDLCVDKASGIATIKRRGEIESILTFDTSQKTKGIFTTPYGRITIDIVTLCINMPSVLTNCFRLEYDICHDDGNRERNIFSVRLI